MMQSEPEIRERIVELQQLVDGFWPSQVEHVGFDYVAQEKAKAAQIEIEALKRVLGEGGD